jgi:hypothetical protein
MARRSHASRLSDIVMDELAGEQTPWDLDKHLSGCLAGYQTDQSYGAAVYFALEALSGIAHQLYEQSQLQRQMQRRHRCIRTSSNKHTRLRAPPRNSENSKANRIETTKGPTESGQIWGSKKNSEENSEE